MTATDEKFAQLVEAMSPDDRALSLTMRQLILTTPQIDNRQFGHVIGSEGWNFALFCAAVSLIEKAN